MTNSKQEHQDDLYWRLVSDPPRISVVTDHPLSYKDYTKDSFDLVYRLGPVYDIIRHPETVTPIAIAVYGDWGTGKSSAMAWLHGLLEKSNAKLKNIEGNNDRVTVRPVWFYPWKYLSKEDVWRGLISEVIINSIDVENATSATVTSAVKQFGMFLGRSFIHTMAGLSIKAKAPGGIAEATLKLDGLKDILDDYRVTSHPEKAYLNEFEESLSEWVNCTLGDNERLVVFIDDLDRCMPDIALQVLEALKLYLNIKKLVFVVGVDRTVIGELVKEYYSKLGVHEDKSRHYLAKMFQMEVEVSPYEFQISQFFQAQVSSVGYWNENLVNWEQDIIQGVMLNLAKSNPREVKRLINSSLMAAAGFYMGSEHQQNDIKFSQAMQVFLIRRILADRHGRPNLVIQDIGNEFFYAWSEIVRNRTNAPRNLEVPEWFIRQQKRANGNEDISEALDRDNMIEESNNVEQPFDGADYQSILDNTKFAGLLSLLRDQDLGNLMRIEYLKNTSLYASKFGITLMDDVIRAAIAYELGKTAETVTSSDYTLVTRLGLPDASISNIEFLSGLRNLKELNISGTMVADLTPIRHAVNLEVLQIGDTPIADLSPIAQLHNLISLSAWSLTISDLAPLRHLDNLKALFIHKTNVEHLDYILALCGLNKLNISYTPVNDLTPLRNLAELAILSLRQTKVSDIASLAVLTNLEELDISYNSIKSIEPLKSLKNLKRLDLSGSKLSENDFDVIGRLSMLSSIRLLNCEYDDSLISKLIGKRPKLRVVR